MHNFKFYNPVQVVFGAGQIASLSQLVSKTDKILLVYGGGSIKQNGVYDQVVAALNGCKFYEFGGIEANPEYETLLKAVEICKSKQIDFILAVGGGSVVDGTKFISAAVNFPLEDKWQILKGHSAKITDVVPFGVVLTLPATGSEMNSGSVVSRRATGEKLSFGHSNTFPKFSILDPEVTYSLSPRQLANGIVDPFIHVTEQYLTTDINSPLQDGFAEVILRTLISVAPKIISGERNYEARSNWMWSATNALNGYIGIGVDHDWATHMIGHELTAAYGLDHAQTLAIIAPQIWRYKQQSKQAKLIKFARNVWNIQDADTSVAIDKAIACTEDFFRSTHIYTKLSDYNIIVDKDLIASNVLSHVGNIGEAKDIGYADIKQILTMAA